MTKLEVTIEAVPKRAFASAIDWPGWSRGAKTPEQAIEALLAYAERYAHVPRLAGVDFPGTGFEVDVTEETEGDASTTFGVPGRVSAVDRRPLDAHEAERRAGLVRAAWRRFDSIAGAAPEELRKGPRGGGRDRTDIVEHVVGADQAYSGQLGIRLPSPDPADDEAVAALREAMLDVLQRPSDGSPIVKRWTTRYAARRIAWHALDHAWEIEDRSNP